MRWGRDISRVGSWKNTFLIKEMFMVKIISPYVKYANIFGNTFNLCTCTGMKPSDIWIYETILMVSILGNSLLSRLSPQNCVVQFTTRADLPNKKQVLHKRWRGRAI